MRCFAAISLMVLAGLLAAGPSTQLDVSRLSYPAQVTDYDCGPAAAAIACQKVVSVRDGVDCGPLSGRFVALCAAENDGISPDSAVGPYLGCGMAADHGACAERLCPQSAYTLTDAMVADAIPRVCRFVTWPEIDSVEELSTLLREENAAVVVAQLGHAYAIVAVNPDGSYVVVDPFRGWLLRRFGFGARVLNWSPSELRRVWSQLQPGDAAGVVL